MSYSNQDGAIPPDSLATAEPGSPALATSEPPPPPTVRVTPPEPAGALDTGRSRPIVLLGGATAVLLVFGLMMTGLFIFKSNQLAEMNSKVTTAESASTAKDAKVTALQKQLTDLQTRLAHTQQQLTGATQSVATTKANRQAISQCLKLVNQALTTARTGSSNELDAALKKLKAPCARADKLA